MEQNTTTTEAETHQKTQERSAVALRRLVQWSTEVRHDRVYRYLTILMPRGYKLRIGLVPCGSPTWWDGFHKKSMGWQIRFARFAVALRYPLNEKADSPRSGG